VQVSIDTKGLEKYRKALAQIETGAGPAIARAMNRAVKSGLTAVSKGVREKFLIGKGALDSTFTQKYASGGDLRAEIRSKHPGMLRISEFRVRPKSRPKRARALTATVRKGGGGSLGRAFWAKGRIFARKTESAYPLEELFAISAPIMISQSDVGEPAHDRIVEIFDKRVDYEMGRLMAKG
jgi:hypothetical protein